MGKVAIFFFLTIGRTEEGRKGLDGAMGSGAPGHGGSRGLGQRGEEAEGVLIPYLSRPGTAFAGVPTVGGGGEQSSSWRRRYAAREGARGGWAACGARG